MSYQYIAIPVISAFIGYITNVVAVRMLFRPRKPINLGFYQVQGLLPRRQQEIAVSLGELVEKELLSLDDVLDRINTPGMQERLITRAVELLGDRLSGLLPRVIPAMFTQMIADSLEKIIRQEGPAFLDQIVESGRDYLTQEVKISQIVEDRVKSYDLKDLEDMIKRVSITELTFIELLGGALGLVIGIVQVLIIWLFPVK